MIDALLRNYRPYIAEIPKLIPKLSIRSLQIFFPLFACTVLLVSFLTLPIIILLFSVTPEHVLRTLDSPHLSSSLFISLSTTLCSSAIIFLLGTPLAYVMARYTFWGKGVLNIAIDLPMVIPPSVAGIGLLLAFGRRSMFGEFLQHFGVSISFTAVAVIMAQIFISAPFYIRSARSGFLIVNSDMETMARSLGATWWSAFRRITLPIAKPYMISGILTSWARALGEFGATIMFAGSFMGKTETMPLAIYSAMNDDLGVAIVLANILLACSLTLMVSVRIFSSKRNLHA